MSVLTIPTKSNQFPVMPEGIHQVTVRSASFSMRESFDDKTKLIPTVMLLIDSDQKDEDDRNFSLPIFLTVSNHEKANMYKFFQDVMGQEVPVHSGQIAFKPDEVTMEDGTVKTYLPQFQNLAFQAVIKHKKKDDGSVRAYVDSYICDGKQKTTNYDMFISDAPSAAEVKKQVTQEDGEQTPVVKESKTTQEDVIKK